MIRPTLCLYNRGDNMFYTAARGFWLKEENPNQGAQVSTFSTLLHYYWNQNSLFNILLSIFHNSWLDIRLSIAARVFRKILKMGSNSSHFQLNEVRTSCNLYMTLQFSTKLNWLNNTMRCLTSIRSKLWHHSKPWT